MSIFSIARKTRPVTATNDTPVPTGDTKASMYSKIASQLIPNKIAKSANGELKLMPFHPLCW